MRMKVQHEISIVVRKPSRDTSATRPSSASFGENAIEWTTKSSLPHVLATLSNNASIWPGTRASSGMTIPASSSLASGSTNFLALSLRYVTASSAPNARNALAQPQAIECSLAMPTTSPLLPSRSLAFTAGTGVLVTRSMELFPCRSSWARASRGRRHTRSLRNDFRHDEFSLCRRDNLIHGSARPNLNQGSRSVAKADDSPFRSSWPERMDPVPQRPASTHVRLFCR